MDIPSEEEHQERSDDVYDLFSAFLNALSERRGGLVVHDFGVMLYIIAGRLRGTLKPNETGMYFGKMLHTAEHTIRQMVDEGHPIVLAEHWRDMEGGEQMIEDLQFDMPNHIPDEWLGEEE